MSVNVIRRHELQMLNSFLYVGLVEFASQLRKFVGNSECCSQIRENVSDKIYEK